MALSCTISLFFFGDYQGVKALIGRTVISTVPTLQRAAGDFHRRVPHFDPATTTVVNGKTVRKEFANDVITTPFDPVATALLARFPLPTNRTAAANNYTRTANDADHQNQFDFRMRWSVDNDATARLAATRISVMWSNRSRRCLRAAGR